MVHWRAIGFLGAILSLTSPHLSVAAQEPSPNPKPQSAPTQAQPPATPPSKSQPAKPGPPTEQQELQKAIDDAENDRAALVRNLEAFLQKYPESPLRAQVYRALVEATLQLRDFDRATQYAERLVAIKPDDPAINILSIQLLERYGDAAGWRRAVSYCTRVIEIVEHTSVAEKSPKVSEQEFLTSRAHDKSSLLLVRGRLYRKIGDTANATRDLETSNALVPSASAAELLGEIAESRKDQQNAILEYARAFALADGTAGTPTRDDLRKKIGNVWRLAHGSEAGLGDYLLQTMDEVTAAAAPPKPSRNAGAKDIYDFVLRNAASGQPVNLAGDKGKVLVLNFWATWCGPCRELAPHFEKIASRFAGQKDVVFYELNCDEDESQVPAYMEKEKPKTIVLYADGLDLLLRVHSFPTMMILDRSGNIVFHEDGFDPDHVDKSLTEAVERTLQSPDAHRAAQ
jgi:thiol-disulfide isomerase/thioredoxin